MKFLSIFILFYGKLFILLFYYYYSTGMKKTIKSKQTHAKNVECDEESIIQENKDSEMNESETIEIQNDRHPVLIKMEQQYVGDPSVCQLLKDLKKRSELVVELENGELMENYFPFKQNVVLNIERNCNFLAKLIGEVLEDVKMNQLKDSVEQAFRLHSKEYSKFRIKTLKHSDWRYYVRFRSVDLNAITKQTKSRYKDLLLVPFGNGIWKLLLPYFYFCPTEKKTYIRK